MDKAKKVKTKPKIFKKILPFILTVSAVITVSLFLYKVGVFISDFIIGLDKVQPNDFTAQAIEGVKKTETCVFKDSEWLVGFGNLQKQENGLYFLASTTPSSTLRYERSVSSKSEIVFSFVPLSGNSPNIVILAHDLFEIIIGDEDSRHVTVKANLVEETPMSLILADNEEKKSFWLPDELVLGKEVIVKIIQEPFNADQHELILNINYDSKKDPMVKSYHFPIPPKFKVSGTPLHVSIGIINTKNTEDVLARFKCFKVSLDDSGTNLTYSKPQFEN